MKKNGESNPSFRALALEYKIRDCIKPPSSILDEVGLREGMTVLDFGCGPGGFSIAAAKICGPKSRIYALDIHSLAIMNTQRAASKKDLRNIQVIHGDYLTDISSRSVDIVLLYDVLHDIRKRDSILSEIHRVLKEEGILSVRDHHLNGVELQDTVCHGGLYRKTHQRRWSILFKPNPSGVEFA